MNDGAQRVDYNNPLFFSLLKCISKSFINPNVSDNWLILQDNTHLERAEVGMLLSREEVCSELP